MRRRRKATVIMWSLVLAFAVGSGCKEKKPEWHGIPDGPAACSWDDWKATCIAGGRVYTCVQGGQGACRYQNDIECALAPVPPKQ